MLRVLTVGLFSSVYGPHLILRHLLYPQLPGVYDKDHVFLSSELQSPGALVSLDTQRLHRHSLSKAELIFLATLPPPPVF